MTSQKFQNNFAKRGTIKEIEEGSVLMPKFGEDGLIPCIATDVETGVILMFAYMNSEALTKTYSNPRSTLLESVSYTHLTLPTTPYV